MNNTPSFRTLIEKVSAEAEVYKIKLPVSPSDVAPVFSEEALSLHYGTLYGNYVKKALDGEGEFQVAGAKLHTLFFEQFGKYKTQNGPTGISKTLIEGKFGSYQGFKDSLTESALSIHGSGWVYLSLDGKIKTIPNHKIVNDVAVIVDMWEHSYIIDFGADKKRYLKSLWSIINWDTINTRLN